MLNVIGGVVVAIVIAMGVVKALELIRKRVNNEGEKK
jgi:capsular polysaccharide biosynthesis protein